MALSIFVPIGYITVLVASLSVFSRIYRKRTAQALAREHGQSWFVEGHPERDIYQTLVQAAGEGGGQNGASAPAVPDVVLKAALLNRAMADVRRIIRMRDDKQALAVLLQKGSVGDELAAKFAAAEKELEAEILDVVSEANTFREGWGQIIFPSASEMVAHLKHKEAYQAIPQQRLEEQKRMKEAGLEIPKPTIEVPALTTPAGTSITIGTPPAQQGQQPQKAGPALSPAMQAANGAASGHAKSSTVEDAGEDEIQKHFYNSIGDVEWDLGDDDGPDPRAMLRRNAARIGRRREATSPLQTLFVANKDAIETEDADPDKVDEVAHDDDAAQDSGVEGVERETNVTAKPSALAGKKKKHKKKAKKPPAGMFGPASAASSAAAN